MTAWTLTRVRETAVTKPKPQQKTHRAIAWLLTAYIITSPLDTIPPLRWLIPQLSAEWVDIFQLPILVIGFLLLLRDRQSIRLPLWGAEFLILVGSFIALTQADNLFESTETLFKDIYMYLFFVMIVNMVKDKILLVRLVKLWQIGVIIQASLIIFSAVINVGKPGARYEEQAYELGVELEDTGIQDKHLVKRQVLRSQGIFAPGRQSGTIANANLAGLYLGGGALLLMGLPLTKRKWLNWGFVGFVAFGLAQTGSNSTLGAFAVAAVVFILFTSDLHTLFFWIGAGILVGGLTLGLLTFVPLEKITAELGQVSSVFEQGVSRVPDSAESRVAMVLSGWTQFRERPIGLAPHGMRESDAERNVHNDYAAYLFERSYLGFMGLLFLFGGACVRAIYSARYGDLTHRKIMIMLLGALLVTMVTELAHEYMREREVWITMAMIYLFADFEFRRRLAAKRERQAKRWPWINGQSIVSNT